MENDQNNIALDSELESILNYAVRCSLKDNGQKSFIPKYLVKRLPLLSDNALWALLNSLDASSSEQKEGAAAQGSQWSVLRTQALYEQHRRHADPEREAVTIVAEGYEQDGAEENLVMLDPAREGVEIFETDPSGEACCQEAGGEDEKIFCRVLTSGLIDTKIYEFVPMMCAVIDAYASKHGHEEKGILEDIWDLEMDRWEKEKTK